MDASTPLISIIVPIHNEAPYLRQCLGSIQRQTYSNIEVLAIDDGSTDESPKILDSFSSDPRFVIRHQANQGLYPTLNWGLDHFTGSFFMVVNSDDYLGEDIVEKCIQLIQSQNPDLIRFYRVDFSLGSEPQIPAVSSLPSGPFNFFKNPKEIDREKNESDDHISCLYCDVCKLYSRELLGDVRYFTAAPCFCDIAFASLVCQKATRMWRLPAYGYFRLTHEDSLSSTGSLGKNTLPILRVCHQLFQFYDDKHYQADGIDINGTYLASMQAYLLQSIPKKQFDRCFYRSEAHFLKRHLSYIVGPKNRIRRLKIRAELSFPKIFYHYLKRHQH